MKTKKALSLLLSAAMTVSLLAGCTPKKADDEASDGNTPKEGVSLDTLLGGMDPDYAFSIIEELSLMGNDGNELGFRNAGSTGEAKAADRIIEELNTIGFEKIDVKEITVDGWEFTSAKLSLNNDSEEIQLSSLAGTVGTPEGGITAELVDAGDGTYANYKDMDVKGKIVLTSFDNYNYWFSAPIYEAELAGAAAMIVCVEGETYSNQEDTMLSFDCAARAEIPVVVISRENAAKLRSELELGTVTATLENNAVLSLGEGTSRIISAVIPGRNTEQNITLGAHYDGYYHSFQDDLFGCGVLLDMAKAMLNAGYQPEHNIIFNFIPAEEYGASSSHYDWCTGVWKMLTEVYPDWAGKTLCHLEIDSVRPDADIYVINSTPEFHNYFGSYYEGLTPPTDPYVNGKKLTGLNGPWSQDYSFAISGIPGLCAGKAGSQWKTYAYHTQYDDVSAWNPVVYEYIYQQYMTMLMGFDGVALSPLDFTASVDALRETLDASLVGADAVSAVEEAADGIYSQLTAAYTDIEKCNELYAKALLAETAGEITDAETLATVRAAINAEGRKLLEAYRVMQGDLMKLDIWDTVTFPHEQLQLNMSSLKTAVTALEAGDGNAALSALINVDTTYLAADFSKAVYEHVGINELDPTRNDLYWGTGKTMPQINTYDVYHGIADKIAAGNADFAAELDEIKKMISDEQSLLDSAVEKEAKQLAQLGDIVAGADVAGIISTLEAILSK